MDMLRGLTGTVSKCFCLQVELIAKIVSTEPRNPLWLLIPPELAIEVIGS
jgi:hypothetical protein